MGSQERATHMAGYLPNSKWANMKNTKQAWLAADA